MVAKIFARHYLYQQLVRESLSLFLESAEFCNELSHTIDSTEQFDDDRRAGRCSPHEIYR